jgi:ubiquinone/menaquinone biosynthesis C-methylase UbiE
MGQGDGVKDHLNLVRRFHDLESSSYIDSRYNDETCEGLSYLTRKAMVLELIEGVPKGRLLDIGCGPGILTSELLNGGREVFCIDLSMGMLANARARICKNPDREHVQFSNCEASQICFRDGSFESVLCIGVMFYVEDYVAVMREIYRVLNKGGNAIVQIDKIGSPSLHSMLIPVYCWLKTRFTGKEYSGMKFKWNVFSYKRFLNDVKRIGYGIEGIEYYDFRVPFVDIIAPKLSLKLGKWLLNYRKNRMISCLAYGMLISLRKETPLERTGL